MHRMCALCSKLSALWNRDVNKEKNEHMNEWLKEKKERKKITMNPVIVLVETHLPSLLQPWSPLSLPETNIHSSRKGW